MVLETGTPFEIHFFFWMTIITHDGYHHPAVMFFFQDEKEGCAFLLAIFFILSLSQSLGMVCQSRDFQ